MKYCHRVFTHFGLGLALAGGHENCGDFGIQHRNINKN